MVRSRNVHVPVQVVSKVSMDTHFATELPITSHALGLLKVSTPRSKYCTFEPYIFFKFNDIYINVPLKLTARSCSTEYLCSSSQMNIDIERVNSKAYTSIQFSTN